MATRLIYGGLGWCAVALAIAGVVVPGLPTTVFVLGAWYCFSRSSPRVERWLRNHRWLGPPLQRFATTGGMPRSAKRAALAAMWIGVLLSSAVLAGLHWAGVARYDRHGSGGNAGDSLWRAHRAAARQRCVSARRDVAVSGDLVGPSELVGS